MESRERKRSAFDGCGKGGEGGIFGHTCEKDYRFLWGVD